MGDPGEKGLPQDVDITYTGIYPEGLVAHVEPSSSWLSTFAQVMMENLEPLEWEALLETLGLWECLVPKENPAGPYLVSSFEKVLVLLMNMLILHMILSFQDQLVLRGKWVLQDQKAKEGLRASCLEMDQHQGNLENLGNQDLKDSKESRGLQVAEISWSYHFKFSKQILVD